MLESRLRRLVSSGSVLDSFLVVVMPFCWMSRLSSSRPWIRCRVSLESRDQLATLPPGCLQERQVEEQAAQADDDGQEGDEGEGEEESPKEDDQIVDMDNDGGRAAPSIKNAFGSEMCPEPAKRRRKSTKTPDAAMATEVQETDDSHPDWLKEDIALKSVVTKLGRFYRCFRNMNPEQNIINRKPAGHQIKGVGDSVGQNVPVVSRPFMLTSLSSSRKAQQVTRSLGH